MTFRATKRKWHLLSMWETSRRSSWKRPIAVRLRGWWYEEETRRLEAAERERKRLESPERLVPDAMVAPSAPEAVTATLGHAPELPAPIEIKPPPVVRRAPSSPPALQSPPVLLAPSPLPLSDFFQPSVR